MQMIDVGIEFGSAVEDETLVGDDVNECDELASGDVTVTVRCSVDVFIAIEEDDKEVCIA